MPLEQLLRYPFPLGTDYPGSSPAIPTQLCGFLPKTVLRGATGADDSAT
jgi:hypothetical protein